MWNNYVALGDSMTEGYGDEVPGIPKKDWPSYVAEFFQIQQFKNLAKSGLRSDEIYAHQFKTAQSLRPDLVSIVAGANDFIQRKWNPHAYETYMEEIIATFAEQGATIITGNFPDFTKYTPIPFFLKPIARREIKTCNRILESLSAKYHTVHIDFWGHPFTDDRSNWSTDFVHPNSLGYKNIGEIIIEELKKVGMK